MSLGFELEDEEGTMTGEILMVLRRAERRVAIREGDDEKNAHCFGPDL
jgi:hypothetical protein